MHYKMPWPNRELESARPFRRSPLYALLQRRARASDRRWDGSAPTFSRRRREQAQIEYAWGHQNWHAWVADEHRACRERVALFDMSSFAKLLVKGRDARAALHG